MAKSMTHWYPKYTGDYAQKTRHLSMLEHGAYTLLMDYYYSTEKPIPANAPGLHRVCMAFAEEEQDAVQSILKQFFILQDDGYHNKRIDEEIVKKQEIAENRRKAAEKSHRSRKKPANGGANQGAKDPANAGANAGANADTSTATATVVSKEDTLTGQEPPPGDPPDDKPPSLDKLLFDLGREVLGSKAGGVVTKLKKAKGEAGAYSVLEISRTKSNPMEYVQGAMRGGGDAQEPYDFDSDPNYIGAE